MKVDRHLERLCRLPEWIVFRSDGRADARHGVDPDAAHSQIGAALHLLDRRVDTESGNTAEADQPIRRLLDELAGQPVVVRLHAGQVEFGIGVRKEVAHHARRAEQHLGIDAVGILLGEAGVGVKVPLIGGGKGHARPADFIVFSARRGIDADRSRRDVGRELPGLAAVAVGDDARAFVVELLGHVLGPDVRRLEDVGIS